MFCKTCDNITCFVANTPYFARHLPDGWSWTPRSAGPGPTNARLAHAENGEGLAVRELVQLEDVEIPFIRADEKLHARLGRLLGRCDVSNRDNGRIRYYRQGARKAEHY